MNIQKNHVNNTTSLLQVTDLSVNFQTRRGLVRAVDQVSFSLAAGEVVGLVGESGSGKSVTGRAILGLITQPPGQVKGSVQLNGRELVGQPSRVWRQLRGQQIAMIFQNPMTALNPVYSIGEQVMEVLRCHKRMNRTEAKQQTVELLQQAGLAKAQQYLNAYPYQLSGGMQQRVMIAIAIACNPSLLIADEPTTALDATIQAQILDLLQGLNREHGMGLLLISHDVSVVAQSCDRVMVMYAGRIVEQLPAASLSGGGILHPYTLGLLQATPHLERRRLYPIPGSLPDLTNLPTGCAFHPRCSLAISRCQQEVPRLRELRPGHCSACHLAEDFDR
jgi:oligopeptide/dipeptide ABC transporter ATP-binding protein